MGTNTIPDRTNGQTIDQTWFNVLKSVIKGDWIPRDNNGVVGDIEGSLGSSTYNWLKAFIASGYNFEGQISWIHTFNGAVSIPQGWMKADGTVCNETNYDALHSSGDWDIYVVASNLDGKNLPDLVGRYPFGVANTTQDGSVAITEVGNADSEIDFQHDHNHTHGTSAHSHQWYDAKAAGTNDQTWNSGMTNIDLPTPGSKSGGASYIGYSTANGPAIGDCYTSGNSAGVTDADATTALSNNTDIRPASIELIPLIRIVP